jgi:hypothetical protein
MNSPSTVANHSKPSYATAYSESKGTSRRHWSVSDELVHLEAPAVSLMKVFEGLDLHRTLPCSRSGRTWAGASPCRSKGGQLHSRSPLCLVLLINEVLSHTQREKDARTSSEKTFVIATVCH